MIFASPADSPIFTSLWFYSVWRPAHLGREQRKSSKDHPVVSLCAHSISDTPRALQRRLSFPRGAITLPGPPQTPSRTRARAPPSQRNFISSAISQSPAPRQSTTHVGKYVVNFVPGIAHVGATPVASV